jgi:hypothetical protein
VVVVLPPHSPAADDPPITRNIILTINQDKPITANPIPACFKILNHSLNFPSSQAAVTILKPPRKTITKVIRANNPKIRLIKLLITVIRFPPCAPLLPQTAIPMSHSPAPNWFAVLKSTLPCAFTSPKVHSQSAHATPRPNNNFLNIFLNF